MLLKFLRKRKNMKRIMWALAILIIPAFVIWGVGTSSKNRDNKPDYAGKVFNKKVSYDDYYNMWNVVRDYAIRSFGNNVPNEFIDQMTWSRIILLEETKRQNLRVSDQEVVEKLTTFPIFQRNGTFDKKLYQSMLTDTARAFEEKLRDDILLEKLREKVIGKISVSYEEVKNEYKKRNEKVKSYYILIPFSESEKDVQYKESDLVNYYENNKAAFKKSEQVNVRYIEIPYAMFEKDIDIKDEAIQRFFEEHLSDFKKPGSDENPVLDDNVKKSIYERLRLKRETSLAEELGYKALDQVILKKDLDEPAKSNLLEIKETGFFSINEEIPNIGWSYEFAKTSFSLNPQDIHGMLIKLDKGFYIIQLKEKKEPYIPVFKEVEEAVKDAYIKEGSTKLAEKKIEKMFLDVNDKIKHGEKFEDAIKNYGLEIKQTDPITRDSYIPELGPAKEFVDMAFTLKPGEISKPLRTLQGWVILEPREFQPIDEAKFLEEKDEFREDFLASKKQGFFDEWFQGLRKKAGFVSYTAK